MPATNQQIALMENFSSIRHKIERIQQQEIFKYDHKDEFESLTNREVEIIILLANGFNNPLIAEHLFISRNTVEQHRKNINRKLKIKFFAQLYQYALAFDLV